MALNRFKLFNPKGSKYCIVENSISIPQSVKGCCTSGVHLRSLFFARYINNLPECLQFSKPKMHAYNTHKRRRGPWLNRLSDRRFVMNISMWT